MISFDSEIRWKEYYIRNNKSKIKKHIRCFPDHLNGIHNEVGFCGSSIKVIFDDLENPISDYAVISCFEIFASNDGGRLKINTKYDINTLKYNDQSECPFYNGLYSEIESMKNNKHAYIINSKNISWNFACPVNKFSRVGFKVYLLLKEEENEYKVINEISSPLFRLKSSRHINKNDILCAPINPLVFNKNENIKQSPLPKEEEEEEDSNFLLNLNSPINTKSIINGNISNNVCNNSNFFPIPSPINKKEKQSIPSPISNLISPISYYDNIQQHRYEYEIYSHNPTDLNSYHLTNVIEKHPMSLVVEKNDDENADLINNNYNNSFKYDVDSSSFLPPSDNDLYIPSSVLTFTEPLSPLTKEEEEEEEEESSNNAIVKLEPTKLKSSYKVKMIKPHTGEIRDLCSMVKSLSISDNNSKNEEKEEEDDDDIKEKEKDVKREELDWYGNNIYKNLKDDSTFYRQIDSKGKVKIILPIISLSDKK